MSVQAKEEMWICGGNKAGAGRACTSFLKCCLHPCRKADQWTNSPLLREEGYGGLLPFFTVQDIHIQSAGSNLSATNFHGWNLFEESITSLSPVEGGACVRELVMCDPLSLMGHVVYKADHLQDLRLEDKKMWSVNNTGIWWLCKSCSVAKVLNFCLVPCLTGTCF